MFTNFLESKFSNEFRRLAIELLCNFNYLRFDLLVSQIRVILDQLLLQNLLQSRPIVFDRDLAV